jgi:hypothetical protein
MQEEDKLAYDFGKREAASAGGPRCRPGPSKSHCKIMSYGP